MDDLRAPNETGSITILTAGLAILVVMVGAGALRVAEAAVLRQRARAAADALALAAAAAPGQVAALELATGARVVRRIEGEGWVEVDVERRGATARARAATPPPAGGAGSGASGLDRRVVAALAEAERRLRRVVPVVSGFRTRQEQMALWARRAINPFPVAPPGTSKHELGLAVDVAPVDAAAVEALGVGLCRPYPNDPVHLEWCGR